MRLTAFADRFPSRLSGGQQQRVAVARALAIDPASLLMDERLRRPRTCPARAELQAELVRMQEDVGITTVMVTHDQEEAQAVAGQLVVMKDGRVEKVGTPEEVCDHPASLFVNGFIGNAKRIGATITGDAQLRTADGSALALNRPLNFVPGTDVTLTTRPEDLSLPSAGTPAPCAPGSKGLDGAFAAARCLAGLRHAVEGADPARRRLPPRTR
ncbi:ABC transporter ATP-binding protein [Pseudooceanicola sp. CBS1P-1]|uniref:ATP-binding cassette domain-containing protein n=1 Tax=Pseudooceanicola albus TaxID=2692189 RepID=A0A6L7G5Y3_9RHOB|nr:ABC transporter ATP-binding protein [Pseudooceanicola endophyticus]MXN19461.1 ATP-binding cassette domain-containing protein [Pseudooceanicola albus]